MYVPIVEIFRAARVGLPEKSEGLAEIAKDLDSVIEGLDIQTAKCGDPSALRDVLVIAREVHDGLRRGVITMNAAALALEATGQDYVDTDASARDEFDRWSGPVKNLDVPQTPVPAPIGNPENPGHVIGGRDPNPSGVPRYLPPSVWDVESPSDDLEDRDEQAEEDREDLGLPVDPSDDDYDAQTN